MTRTRTKPLLIVTGLTAALALTGCAGSASQKASQNGGSGSGGGMIEQLTFPSDADAPGGGLVNSHPNSPKPAHRELAVRAAHRAQQPHLRGDAVARHEVDLGGCHEA